MAKTLREQLASLGLVSEFKAQMADEMSRAREEKRARAQRRTFGEASRVLREYKAAVRERRMLRADYGDIIVEYRRAHEKVA